MTIKTIKVDCDTAMNPHIRDGKLQIFVDGKTCFVIDPECDNSFYNLNIGHDSTAPPIKYTCCCLQIMTASGIEYVFEFPMTQTHRALEWFHIIHEILTPEKRGFFKWVAKVVPSRS